MIKIVLYSLALVQALWGAELVRPKPRLLFYDEEGNLVKTYSNPYLQNLRLNAGLPIYGNFLNPFFGFIKDFGSMFAFTVPVSNEVIQQINKDPQYHNQLMVAPVKEPVIVPNRLCEGRRAQIPSPNFCNNYLNCWDGWAVEQECPKGLLFSNKGYCDYSDNVNCEARKLREQPSTQPRCNKDFETFRNQLDCNEFFVCVNRQPVKFKCPADLAYSQHLGVCDYPAHVDCSSSAVNTEIFNSPPSSPGLAAPTIPPSPPLSDPVAPPSLVSPAVTDVPSATIIPSKPTKPSMPDNPPASSQPSLPIIPAGSLISPMPFLPAAIKPDDVKTVLTENSIVNTQSWTSTHIATSLEDAINQLKHRNIMKSNV
ncbi:unnamed protein product [Arctia plantaginis]|uniref:Chitin-binding type-2 domain-containing protein n=1 Tax=Arctia plantaginis TaxID=874455 RepID=A0A8S1BIH1_ARCPL|nr:unnamed protein product [Arctia plantaginis]